MTKITTLGIDLAKNVFQIASFNQHGKMVHNRSFSRTKFKEFLSNHPRCLIGMEACGSSHYWANQFISQGHQVKLLPPAFVKGFVYGNKNDSNDAKAIALAALQNESPIVHVKTPHQLHLQALLRVRDRQVQDRTRCANQIRGLLSEHGIIMTLSIRSIRKIDISMISEPMCDLINVLMNDFRQRDQAVIESDKVIARYVRQDPVGKRLLAMPGFGSINAMAALIINPADFNNGRHYAAYLGLAPKQSGTGGVTRTQGISKRGNTYHRQLLCHGARAFLNFNKNHTDPLWLWAHRIKHRKGQNIAVAALANKLARISWRVMRGENYQVDKAVQRMNS